MEINLNVNIPNIRVDIYIHQEDEETLRKLDELGKKITDDTEKMKDVLTKEDK